MFFKPAEKKFGTKPAPQAPATAALSSNDPHIDHLLKNLIVAVTALHDVLTRENDALDHADTRAFSALQDEKVAVARRYETLMTTLMNRKDITFADLRLKQQLLAMEEGFSSVMKSNLQKLERMKTATERLGEYIMNSARKSAESQSQFAYGAAGTMQRGVKSTFGISEQA